MMADMIITDVARIPPPPPATTTTVTTVSPTPSPDVEFLVEGNVTIMIILLLVGFLVATAIFAATLRARAQTPARGDETHKVDSGPSSPH